MVLNILCITLFCISVAFGAPNVVATSPNIVCDVPVKLDSSTNIWNEYALHPNSIYRATVTKAIENIANQEDKSKALSIANTGSFVWM
jgi:cellulose 1,4-beta-cellobiosidase